MKSWEQFKKERAIKSLLMFILKGIIGMVITVVFLTMALMSSERIDRDQYPRLNETDQYLKRLLD